MLRAIELLLESYELILSAALIIASTYSAWVIKKRMKKKMQYFTGKQASDDELVSISRWMSAYKEHERRHGADKR